MSFIRTKTFKGKPYYYLVESKRDKSTGKVRQKVLKYYGREKPKGYKPKPKKKETSISEMMKEAQRERLRQALLTPEEKRKERIEWIRESKTREEALDDVLFWDKIHQDKRRNPTIRYEAKKEKLELVEAFGITHGDVGEHRQKREKEHKEELAKARKEREKQVEEIMKKAREKAKSEKKKSETTKKETWEEWAKMDSDVLTKHLKSLDVKDIRSNTKNFLSSTENKRKKDDLIKTNFSKFLLEII